MCTPLHIAPMYSERPDEGPQLAPHCRHIGTLAELQNVLSVDSIRDLLQLYLVDTECQILRIREANTLGNLGAMAGSAHILTATAGNVGAMKVSALARKLDRACHDEQRGTARDLVEELVIASAATSDAIRSWIKHIASPVPSEDQP
jgi:hypothetical protein